MPNDRLQLARRLKQDLLDYVLDAEDELAIALETYTAQESKRLSTSAFKGSDRTDFVLDQFLTEGQTDPEIYPIQQYLRDHPKLTEPERALLQSWEHAFIGLFQLEAITTDGIQAVNWLTQKSYQIFDANAERSPTLARLKVGDIIQTRILPISPTAWMMSGPALHLGALGDKKLAVAIGSFRQHHPDYLYADAPDLLAEAWTSVEMAHQSFIDFFDGAIVTLSGADLHRKLKAYQAWLTQRELDKSGIDGSKSLKTLAAEAGISADEMADRLSAFGVDAATRQTLTEQQSLNQMVRPPLELPPALRSAEAVTVLTDLRGGQVFLPTYHDLLNLLSNVETLPPEAIQHNIQTHLNNTDFKPFVWRSLAKQHPQALEQAFQIGLEQPTFSLAEDLDSLLRRYHDRLDPPLPETASVPMHLHQLFQRAIAQVKPTKKAKKKTKGGFG